MESKKNAHRLNRIFRKPKTMASPRNWREVGEDDNQFFGVSLAWVNAMVNELTDDDRARVAAGQDPPPAVQEELARRAARFGLSIGTADEAMQKRMERFGTAPQEAVEDLTQNLLLEADAEKLKMRESRFKASEQVAMDEAMQKRMGRFGTNPAAAELKLSEADREAMQRRQGRFAT